jgi:CRISPR-associated protein Cas2
MRILVILSPTNKWGTKTEYTMFRKFLISDGYMRIAPEVFMRIVQNRKAAQKHYRRMEHYLPTTGTVRVLKLTEKQYANMYMPVAEPDYQETVVGTNCHIML